MAAGVPLRVTNKETAQQAFGYSSMLATMCAAWLTQTEVVELWAVALDDLVAGVKAAGTITFTGPATAAGTLQLYVAGKKVPVGVTSAMTAAQLATATAAAINADATLPITAAVNGVVTTQVDTTARHKGLVGNSIDVRANYNQEDRLPPGVGITIVCPTAGAGNPDITAALAAIGAVQYQTIVMPYTDANNLTALEGELSTRWDGLHANDGHAYTAVAGTHADASTLGDSRNSPHLTVMGVQKSPTWLPIIAAQVAAADAAEPDPARPRQTLPLKSVWPPSVADRYTRAERNIHLGDGIATYTVDEGGVCRIERLVTTYKTNAQNAPDASYRDVEVLRSLAFIRYQVRARISSVYPRHKLAGDDIVVNPGQAVATPRSMRTELIAVFKDLERAAIVEDIEQFKDELNVRINRDDPNRVDALMPPDLVNQLRVFAGVIQYRL